jgi:ankyrin repeat protein
VVILLLLRGAHVLAATSSKATALHCAVEANRPEVVRALMQHVAENEEKKTALTMAKNAEGEVASACLDCFVTLYLDKTAWDIAYSAKNNPVCQVLKEMGDANSASSSCTVC